MKIKTFERKIKEYSLLKFILHFYIVCILIPVFKESIVYLFHIYLTDGPKIYDFFILNFIKIVIVAPLFETFICQYAVFKLLSQFPLFRNHQSFIIVISAASFGIMHYYSLIYIVYAFIMGLFLMYAYMLRLQKEDSFKAVSSIHALINLSLLVFNYLQHWHYPSSAITRRNYF